MDMLFITSATSVNLEQPAVCILLRNNLMNPMANGLNLDPTAQMCADLALHVSLMQYKHELKVKNRD